MTRIPLLALGAAVLLTLPTSAGQQADQPAAASAEVVYAGTQTNCPVGGGEIDPKVFVDVQGQRVYFCCPGCDGAYEKDPETYLAKIAAKGQTVASVQTVCPVSGEAIDPASFVEFNGRRVFFCCDDCAPTFQADPATYLSTLE
ncbi:MAG: hypothetical protein R3D98_09870 [Candidatus Krumholzibacteriia bacterium]